MFIKMFAKCPCQSEHLFSTCCAKETDLMDYFHIGSENLLSHCLKHSNFTVQSQLYEHPEIAKGLKRINECDEIFTSNISGLMKYEGARIFDMEHLYGKPENPQLLPQSFRIITAGNLTVNYNDGTSRTVETGAYVLNSKGQLDDGTVSTIHVCENRDEDPLALWDQEILFEWIEEGRVFVDAIYYFKSIGITEYKFLNIRS